MPSEHPPPSTGDARVVVVTGTGTGVGKTWVSCALIDALRAGGRRVAARKPVQSLDPGDRRTDAEVLAGASGEEVDVVCPPHRTYRLAMAPPMAARQLGATGFTVSDLAAEIAVAPETDLAVVEGAGGACSPLADDGDTVDLARALGARWIVVVAPAGLGTIHDVRATVASLAGLQPRGTEIAVYLNGYSPRDTLHRLNRAWLDEECGLTVVTDAPALAHLVSRS